MSDKKISVSLEGRMDSLGNTLKQAETETERHTRAMVSGFERVDAGIMSVGRSLGTLASGALGGLAFSQIATEAIRAALAAEKLGMQFKASTGDATLAARELAYVRQLSESLGLSFNETATAYGKFLASTRNTAIEGEPARRVFEAVSKSVTALGLSVEEANGIFLALSQMMSKGKVSAEELSGQLGERLPGALKLAADGMGMTTAQLLKQMQEGKIMSSELLPRLADQLEKTYGKAAEEAAQKGQAGINRFKNEVTATAVAIGEKLVPALNQLANAGANYLQGEREGRGPVAVIARYLQNDLDRIRILYGEYKTLLGEVMQRSPLGMSGGADTKFWQGVSQQGRDMTSEARSRLQSNYFMNHQPVYANTDPQMARVEADRRAGQEEINRKRAEADKKAAEDANKKHGASRIVDGTGLSILEATRLKKEELAKAVQEFGQWSTMQDALKQADQLNPYGKMTEEQQSQFDYAAMLQVWRAKRADYEESEKQAIFSHNAFLAASYSEMSESKLRYMGREEDAILTKYAFEREHASLQLQWTLDQTAMEEEEKARLIEQYRAKEIQAEHEKAIALANLWWGNSQQYISFAEQMTTMGLQMLLFDEDQKSQIGSRMLATSIRFGAEALQSYMMNKAKEHVLNAAAMAGAVKTKTVQAAAEMSIGATQAAAWTAYFSAMSLNPFGGEAFIPAATAMAAATSGFGAATASISGIGAGTMAAELGMAAAWAGGGVAVGALGNAAATSLEGGTSGSTNAAGYGAGTPGSPIVTQPAYGSSNQQPITVHINLNGTLLADPVAMSRWTEESFAPIMRDLSGRNVIFIPDK